MVCFTIIILPFYCEKILGTLLTPWTNLTAKVALALIHYSGMEAAKMGTVISHPAGFAYEIYFRCTGFLPIAFLVVSILAYPRPIKYKIIGIMVGAPFLILFNLVRLVDLFYIGVNNPTAFHFAHSIFWEALTIITVFGLWLFWLKWSGSSRNAISK